MFVGHYGPAFAVKAGKRPPSLGAAFIAVQAVDIGWSVLVMNGVEYGRVVPDLMALSDLSLDHMPWTHSLPAAVVWSLAALLIYRLLDRRAGWVAALLIGACVFSHWLLDYLTHAPDLALTFDGPKVGLGWWDNVPLGIAAEAVALFGGFFIYLASTTPIGTTGKWAPWALIALFCGLYAFDKLGPPPPDLKAAAPMALGAYVVIAALGFALDRTRAPKARLQVQS